MKVLDELGMWVLFGCALAMPAAPAEHVIALLVFAAFSRISDRTANASLARSAYGFLANKRLVEVLGQLDHPHSAALDQEVTAAEHALSAARGELTREASFHAIRYYLSVLSAAYFALSA